MINVDKLTVKYGEKEVLKEFSCEITKGDVNIVTGKSGSGKTTFLNVIMGLNKDYSGSILGLEDKKISSVFQEDRLIDDMSVLKNLTIVNNDIERITEAMIAFDMDSSINEKVFELSGGMKRRIAIIRALIIEFDILILDEPFVGIDKLTLEKVIEYIKKVCEGKTIIIASHDENVYKYFSKYKIIKVKENNCG